MAGLERRAAHGLSLVGIESVASFFISRVDTEVDNRLMALADEGSGELTRKVEQLHGQAAIANARLAYKSYKEAAASDRWQALAAKGGSLQRLLWASTGVKDKAFAPTRYVTELVASDTVNTMPETTLKALGDFSGPIVDTISNRYDEAEIVARDLRKLGIALDDVATVLEEKGIESFAKSWNKLVAAVEDQLKNAGAQATSAGAVSPASSDGSISTAPAAATPLRLDDTSRR